MDWEKIGTRIKLISSDITIHMEVLRGSFARGVGINGDFLLGNDLLRAISRANDVGIALEPRIRVIVTDTIVVIQRFTSHSLNVRHAKVGIRSASNRM